MTTNTLVIAHRPISDWELRSELGSGKWAFLRMRMNIIQNCLK